MQRTPVNPWPWSLNFGFNQAEIIEGHRRELICAGQAAIDADGTPQRAKSARLPRTHDRVGGDCGRLTHCCAGPVVITPIGGGRVPWLP